MGATDRWFDPLTMQKPVLYFQNIFSVSIAIYIFSNSAYLIVLKFLENR